MVRKINSNKFGVIEYAIDTEEDLEKLPRKETDNTVYAILSKGGQNLIYLYSKELKDYILINGDLEGINIELENIGVQLDNKASWVTPEQFGAKGNAFYYNKSDKQWYEDKDFTKLSNDDSDALQQAINYAKDNKLKLWAYREKRYMVTKGLRIAGLTLDIDFNNATIIGNGAIEKLLTINTSDERGGSIKNLTLECNYNCNHGLYIQFAKGSIFSNITIKNALDVSCNVTDGYGFAFTNMQLMQTQDERMNKECIGLIANCSDSLFEKNTINNFKYGVQNNGSNNFFLRVHPSIVLADSELLRGSECFSTSASLRCELCTYDTYYIGVRIKDLVSVTLINCSGTHSSNFYNNTTMSELPYFLYYDEPSYSSRTIMIGCGENNFLTGIDGSPKYSNLSPSENLNNYDIGLFNNFLKSSGSADWINIPNYFKEDRYEIEITKTEWLANLNRVIVKDKRVIINLNLEYKGETPLTDNSFIEIGRVPNAISPSFLVHSICGQGNSIHAPNNSNIHANFRISTNRLVYVKTLDNTKGNFFNVNVMYDLD